MSSMRDHFNILLIGDCGVGKSCLLLRFTENTYTESFIATIGVDFKVRNTKLGGKDTRFQVYDTNGQERFRAITSSFYRGADGVLLVYDVTNTPTFNNIQRWLDDIDRYSEKPLKKFLVGNKCDVEDREVAVEAGEELAKKLEIPFMETSAKEPRNVEEVFLALGAEIKKKTNPAAERVDSARPMPQPQPTSSCPGCKS